jgi:alanine racemase
MKWVRSFSKLKIFPERIDYNLSEIKRRNPNRKIIFMMKANAYGHGLSNISTYIEQYHHEIDIFGVASFAEAVFLRKQNQIFKAQILVFSEFDLQELQVREFMRDWNVIPVISSLNDLEIFLQDTEFKRFPLFLKFNIGMNRLGINIEELETVVHKLQKSGRKGIDHLMGHFSCSYLKSESNQIELERFEQIQDYFCASSIIVKDASVRNSGGIENNFKVKNETHLRPGLMLYGPRSSLHQPVEKWTGKLISKLTTKVVSVREISKDQGVGYGLTKCPEDGLVLYLPLGYGDGISTGYSGIAFDIEGVKAVCFGRVNMDLMALFTTDPNAKKLLNKEVAIWESRNDIMKISKHLKVSSYEVFCRLAHRVPRDLVV